MKCPHLSITLGALALMVGLTMPVAAQEYGARMGTVKRGGKVSFAPTGPGVLFDAMDPVVRKWYVPQELYAEYAWKQWQYSNYARTPYQRYVSTAIEGSYFYDAFGNMLTQGWLIYDWREQNPQPFGSSLYKDGRFSSWFSRLLIASDHKGQYHYAITVGDEIRTTLTPMTFSKPKFNGLQWDFASDKYAATLLLSRVNAPTQETDRFARAGDQRTEATDLLGSRVEVQVGDFVKLGGTFISAFQTNTQTGSFGSDMFRGQLSGPQNFSHVTLIEIRLSDESPDDGEGGAALFASDIILHDIEGHELRGSEIGFRAQIEGGLERQGFLAADGHETIELRFDLSDPSYTGPDPSQIDRISLELVVANDYLIEIRSDRQDGVYLPWARAAGNVMDSSNQRVLHFDYGLPTANQIAGFSLEVNDLAGFQAYGEFDTNRRYRQFPNVQLEQHKASFSRSDVWLLNVSRSAYPWFGFLEAFDCDPGYRTAMPLLDQGGEPHYGAEFYTFEFVDDNDDQDQYPDWFRRWGGNPDREVFPGWDENNDFISDFNQNDNEASPNLIPDYEEPFLRFHVDRPEFLYGVDMNHNQWPDRFENDERADYPYQPDYRGINVYGGAFLAPDARLHVGFQRIREISTGHRNRATYVLLTLDRDDPRWGRLRIFQDLRRVRDNIVDDLLQWVQEANTRGAQRLVQDVLPAQDTWVNSSWAGLDLSRASGLYLGTKVAWRLYHQMGSKDAVELRHARRNGYFLGLINKAEQPLSWRGLTLTPRWKSAYRREAPVPLNAYRRSELSELFMLMAKHRVLRRSTLEGGLEYHWFTQLRDPVPPGAEESYRGLVIAGQLTNQSDYQGYLLTTIVGFELQRRKAQDSDPLTSTRGFVTVYAGVER